MVSQEKCELSPGTSSTSLEAGLELTKLFLGVSTSQDSLDGFLSNVAILTLKLSKKNSTFCSLKYLEAFMPHKW